MSKIKFNLVGNTFTHLTNGNKGYSVHGKESKYIEWVGEDGEGTFYIDNTIKKGIIEKRDGPKNLWLLESRLIKNLIKNFFVSHFSFYIQISFSSNSIKVC